MLLENAYLLSPLTEGCRIRVGQNAVGKCSFIVTPYTGLLNSSWSKCCWKTHIYCRLLQRAAEPELVKMLLENAHLLSPLTEGCRTRVSQNAVGKYTFIVAPYTGLLNSSWSKMPLKNAHLLSPFTEGCRTRVGQNAVGKRSFIGTPYRGLPNSSLASGIKPCSKFLAALSLRFSPVGGSVFDMYIHVGILLSVGANYFEQFHHSVL